MVFVKIILTTLIGVCDLTTLMVFMKISCLCGFATRMVFMKITDNYRTFSPELEVGEGAGSSPDECNLERWLFCHVLGFVRLALVFVISQHSWCL
jgi:hypothetical protein